MEEWDHGFAEVPHETGPYWWDQKNDAVFWSLDELLAARRLEALQCVQQWLRALANRWAHRAVAVQRLGWFRVLAIDISRAYVFHLARNIAKEIKDWKDATIMLEQFIKEDSIAEEEKKKTRNMWLRIAE